jgi:nucleotide-binding universal stress UspA family protein
MPVVVGYVSTPPGEAALRAGIAEARLRGTSLVVVLTARDTGPDEPAFSAEQQLDALDARLRETGVEHELRHFADDRDAADQILRTAAQTGAELIVIGQRTRTPVGKLLLGSTSQRVLLDAACPVLAVKAGPA